MDVRLLSETPEHEAAWDAFVARQNHTTSDHLWGWRRILQSTFGFDPFYLAAMQGSELMGILPLFRIPRGFGKWALSSIPFGNYGGICADSEEVAERLLDEAKRILARTRSAYLELRSRRPLDNGTLQPQSLYSRYSFPLHGDIDKHAQQLGGSNRNKINRAIKQGLRVITRYSADEIYLIHSHTTRRLGTPCFPKRYFALILETFKGKAEVCLVEFQGQFIAYDLVLTFKQDLVCQFNGSLEAYFKLYPNKLLVWHLIETGCRRGMRELDYCRSRAGTGNASFKRELRMKEEPLGYQYYLPKGDAVPQRNPSNAKYAWLIRTWQRLPLAVTRMVGPALVRYVA